MIRRLLSDLADFALFALDLPGEPPKASEPDEAPGDSDGYKVLYDEAMARNPSPARLAR